MEASLDWTFVLQLRADLPVPGSNDEFVTATELYLVQPEELTGEMYAVLAPDNEWQTCEQWMFAVDDSTWNQLDSIDPQCRGVLSEECLDALSIIAASGDCKTESIPRECKEKVTQEYLATGSECQIPHLPYIP